MGPAGWYVGKDSKRQKIAAVMLGSGYRIAEVADKLSVAEETVSRWKNNADFSEQAAGAYRIPGCSDCRTAGYSFKVSSCYQAGTRQYRNFRTRQG